MTLQDYQKQGFKIVGIVNGNSSHYAMRLSLDPKLTLQENTTQKIHMPQNAITNQNYLPEYYHPTYYKLTSVTS